MDRIRTTFIGPGSWRKRVHLRGHLARLRKIDPRLIVDIGIGLEAAEGGIAKPFWRRYATRPQPPRHPRGNGTPSPSRDQPRRPIPAGPRQRFAGGVLDLVAARCL